MAEIIAELDSKTLPLNGSHLIEASAGTGKTYNIVRLYLRLLLEKEYSVDQILVMTFTVAATAEIRNRLNEFLRDALEQWDVSDDELIQQLRRSLDPTRARLLLKQAILTLDEAAIYTIHGFCKRALSQQAFFSGLSFNADMEADASLLKLQACEDWYRTIQQTDVFLDIVDRWPTPDSFAAHWQSVLDSDIAIHAPAEQDITELIDLVRTHWPAEREQFATLNKVTARSNAATVAAYESVCEKLDALLAEDTQPEFSKFELDKAYSTTKKQTQMPTSFQLIRTLIKNQAARKLSAALTGVQYIREHIRADKKRLDQLDFNDLILQLRDALCGSHGTEMSQALRSQFPAALVDEFQDTDPDQYSILNTIYRQQPGTFLCMIGDPKQAIYGFRGGDVFAYLTAKRHVDYQWTMNTNYRSSPAVINGYNQAFLQAATDSNSDVFGFGIDYRRVNAAKDKTNPVFSDSRAAVQWVHFQPDELPSRGLAKSFQERITQWVTQEIVVLLNQVSCDGQPVKAGDIALLVRSYREAQLLQGYLTDAGLASVYLSSRQNVLQTEEATSLLTLLKGIWQLENDRLFMAALASSWIGLDVATLDAINHDEHRWSQWQLQFERWRTDWQMRGLMSMLLDVLQTAYRPRTTTLERSLTNRLHLAERLQMESGRHRLPDALLHWFERALTDDSRADENLLRLESDDALIKIITMHGAKGLEYPIVFLPFISYYGASPMAPAVYRYHDRTSLDLKLSFLAGPEEVALTMEEEKAELVRLLYVAATRAEKRLYACMAPFASFAQSALAQTLKVSAYDLSVIEQKVCTGNDATLLTVTEPDINLTQTTPPQPTQAIAPATFHGHIERDWWLSSFSALTRHVGHSAHSAPDRDEEDKVIPLPEDQPLRYRLTKGAEAGNLLHDTLEHCDFSAPNFTELLATVRERYSSLCATFTDTELQQWLREILDTPMAETSLSQLPYTQTLRESEFYFPMQGSHIRRLSEFISQRRQQPYELPDRHKLKGMMHGFIDLIFEANGRYYVADYKSTHLGFHLDDYQPEQLRHSIYGSSYDVQYSIYALALHRYLKTRIRDYRPEQHFGGVYYLYLRGMHPEQSSGIFYDNFSASELATLDDIFGHAHTGASDHV